MIRALRKLWARNEDGASAVEYGLLVAGIAVVIIGVVFALGGAISNSFDKTCDAINTGSGTAVTGNCAPAAR